MQPYLEINCRYNQVKIRSQQVVCFGELKSNMTSVLFLRREDTETQERLQKEDHPEDKQRLDS